ncbi:hypothetical protein [Actinophytocola sediminis]
MSIVDETDVTIIDEDIDTNQNINGIYNNTDVDVTEIGVSISDGPAHWFDHQHENFATALDSVRPATFAADAQPVAAESTNPASVNAVDQPVAAESAAVDQPVAAESALLADQPVAVASEKPANKPADVQSDKPANKPAHVQSDKPAHVDSDRPAAAESVKPANVDQPVAATHEQVASASVTPRTDAPGLSAAEFDELTTAVGPVVDGAYSGAVEGAQLAVEGDQGGFAAYEFDELLAYAGIGGAWTQSAEGSGVEAG